MSRTRHLRDHRRVRGLGRSRRRTRSSSSGRRASFFRNHSWGYQPPRGRPVHTARPCRASGRPGVRQWVLFHTPEPRRVLLRGPQRPGRRRARARSCSGDRSCPVVGRRHRARVLRGRPTGAPRHVPSHRRRGHRSATYEFERSRLGVLPGRRLLRRLRRRPRPGVYRGDQHVEGEVWDVQPPDDVRRRGGPIVRVRARLGRELHACSGMRAAPVSRITNASASPRLRDLLDSGCSSVSVGWQDGGRDRTGVP